MTSLKGYALKAFVNTVDHLGSMSYKVNCFLDEKSDELSTIELPFSCFEQRFRTCQQYINSEGLLPQQSLFIRTPSHHARYIIHGKEFPPSRSCIREHPHAAYVPGPRATEETFMFAKASPNKGSDKRGTSPYRFHLACSPSPVSRATSPNRSSSNTKMRYPTEPRRSASPRAGAGRDRSDNDLLMYASKNKRMFKALLSMRKPKSGVSLHKFLDDN
ncbi:hypothetical protein SAY87_014525 [Trapa incisa]|uniref:Uncharacterized protein n=1 Tax=Trapa incisa TaxID=236973 RepID=A0AAN7JKF4_9MYRT|nr:hypothetical protein SAY87_014525 [Trapa incisa]